MKIIEKDRPIELLFREDWAETPAARPITQHHVTHAELILGLYGPGAGELKKSHHDDDPYYVWSGKCSGPWVLALAHRGCLIDLSRGGIVRWRSRQSGERQLRLVLQLADGRWVISQACDGQNGPWHVFEFQVESTSWSALDIVSGERGDSLPSIPLSRISAIGFSDLMPGDDRFNCSRLDWIEVWGRSVLRSEALAVPLASGLRKSHQDRASTGET